MGNLNVKYTCTYNDGSRFKEQTGSGYVVYQGEASSDDKLVAEEYHLGHTQPSFRAKFM